MAFVQRYFAINPITVGSSYAITTTGNGILLALDVLWFPQENGGVGVNSSESNLGLAIESPIRFYLRSDGNSSEPLGTDSSSGDVIQVSKVNQNYSWIHPNHTDFIWGSDFARQFADGALDFVGRFIGGMSIVPVATPGTTVDQALSIGAQYIVFD